MSGSDGPAAKILTIKILGREYRVRSDADEAHLTQVAGHVDGVLRDIQRNTPDTQDAAILAALNIASDLLQARERGTGISPGRIQALIELADSV